MNPVVKILMERNGMTKEEAEETVKQIKNDILDGANPEEALFDIGLEPDYIFDVMP